MQRNFGGVEGNAPARAKTSGVGMDTLEIVEPESRIVVSRIVLDEGQLCPAHRTVEPGVRGGFTREQGARSGRQYGFARVHRGAVAAAWLTSTPANSSSTRMEPHISSSP